jgi:hypothetical protein
VKVVGRSDSRRFRAAIVESLLDRGDWVDAHDPRCVERVAARPGAARRALPPADRPARAGLVARGLRPPRAPAARRRFDFPGSARGAEWIDRLAAQARRRLDEHVADNPVVGHGDWRVEHLRFADGALSAIYDWRIPT